MPSNPFESLPVVAANQVPLTPLQFLPHTAAIYPHHTAVIHGDLRYDYAQLYRRSQRLASALAARGIGKDSTVSITAPNIPAHLAHFKCPRHVVFGELPKTSTGKIQKFLLRERARDI